MGKFYDSIPPESGLIEWAKQQKVFWVASAPLSGNGHVNVSPKGYDSFEFVDSRTCWYADYTGSGNETVSHIYEPGNARVTIMFSAFEGPPRILRLYGKGKVFERGSAEFEHLLAPDDPRRKPGIRAIIWLDIIKVGTSCGFSVPYFDYKAERPKLQEWLTKRERIDCPSCPGDILGPEHTTMPRPDKDDMEKGGLWNYWVTTNFESLDGLPGLGLAGAVPLLAMAGQKAKVSTNGGQRRDAAVYVAFTMGVVVALVALRTAEVIKGWAIE